MAGQQLFNFGTQGGNQYGSYPGMPNYNSSNMPGIAPVAPSYSGNSGLGYTAPGKGARQNSPSAPNINSQYYTVSPLDPKFTAAFTNYLGSEVGKGASPYPGVLSASYNPLLMQGAQSFAPGGTMSDLLTTGSPVTQLPAWQAAVDASQSNIQRNLAQLKEQFSVGGGLVGSPYGDAVQNYLAQTGKDQNAMLLQSQAAALESAMGRKLNANEFQAQFGQYLQGLDQATIDRMYQEYIRTSPEYNPLMNAMYGLATTFPPTMKKESGQGILGQILSHVPGAAAAGITAGQKGGAGAGALAALGAL